MLQEFPDLVVLARFPDWLILEMVIGLATVVDGFVLPTLFRADLSAFGVRTNCSTLELTIVPPADNGSRTNVNREMK